MRLSPYHFKNMLEAGCDEAGRGCLAGPVVAAAVILPLGVRIPGLDDSKQLSHAKREQLRPLIEERAIAWSVAAVGPAEIDQVNILQASFKAMHLAIAALSVRPEHLLIDGDRFMVFGGIPHTCHIKGDSRFRSIAAASVLAKTHRDALMVDLHKVHPEYNWEVNKGYPTADHRSVIEMFGITDHHRKSFRMLKEVGVQVG